jgi:hypothetical protein
MKRLTTRIANPLLAGLLPCLTITLSAFAPEPGTND